MVFERGAGSQPGAAGRGRQARESAVSGERRPAPNCGPPASHRRRLPKSLSRHRWHRHLPRRRPVRWWKVTPSPSQVRRRGGWPRYVGLRRHRRRGFAGRPRQREAGDPPSAGPSTRCSRKNQIGSRSRRRWMCRRPTSRRDVDLVLVEAAPAQIMSSLAEIDADHANYLGIVVDDELAVSQRARAAKQPAADMKQYNRGVVPRQQKVQVAPEQQLLLPTPSAVRLRSTVAWPTSATSSSRRSARTRRSSPTGVGRCGLRHRQPSERFSIDQQSPDALHASTETASPSPSQQAASPGDDRSYGNAKLGLARRASAEARHQGGHDAGVVRNDAGEEAGPFTAGRQSGTARRDPRSTKEHLWPTSRFACVPTGRW